MAYYRRRLPRFLKAKELVDAGRIGPVALLTYRYSSKPPNDLVSGKLPWRFEAEHAGGGLIMDVGCHALDIFDYILGPITHVQGSAANRANLYNVEDAVTMHCRFACEALGVCAWNFAAATLDDMVEITGSKGKLMLSVFGNEPVRLETADGTQLFDLPNPVHIQQPFIQSIVDQLQGRGECPSTGASAQRTSLVIDKVLSDYYGGRDDAFWLRGESWPGRRPFLTI